MAGVYDHDMKDWAPWPSGNPPALYRLKAYELLSDGEWHDYYQVLTRAAAVVNPAQAYRLVERRRKRPPADGEERQKMIRSGQREMARNVLGKKERFEHRTLADGRRQIRLLPVKEPTPEERSAASKRGWEGVNAERRAGTGRKGWETRRREAGHG